MGIGGPKTEKRTPNDADDADDQGGRHHHLGSTDPSLGLLVCAQASILARCDAGVRLDKAKPARSLPSGIAGSCRLVVLTHNILIPT